MKLITRYYVGFICLFITTSWADQSTGTNEMVASPPLNSIHPPTMTESSPPTNAIQVEPPSTKAVKTIIKYSITSEEWQKLRMARAAAIKAQPELLKRASELSIQMRDFQQKLDAAMIKTDPNVAPIIAKIENHRPVHSFMQAPRRASP